MAQKSKSDAVQSELEELLRLRTSAEEKLNEVSELGNASILNLQREYDALVEKKRRLLREIDELESKLARMKKKVAYTETTYGDYLDIIRRKKNGF